jgi:hypothetical protein
MTRYCSVHFEKIRGSGEKGNSTKERESAMRNIKKDDEDARKKHSRPPRMPMNRNSLVRFKVFYT